MCDEQRLADSRAWGNAQDAARQAAVQFIQTMDAAIEGHIPLEDAVPAYQAWQAARREEKRTKRVIEEKWMKSR